MFRLREMQLNTFRILRRKRLFVLCLLFYLFFQSRLVICENGNLCFRMLWLTSFRQLFMLLPSLFLEKFIRLISRWICRFNRLGVTFLKLRSIAEMKLLVRWKKWTSSRSVNNLSGCVFSRLSILLAVEWPKKTSLNHAIIFVSLSAEIESITLIWFLFLVYIFANCVFWDRRIGCVFRNGASP